MIQMTRLLCAVGAIFLVPMAVCGPSPLRVNVSLPIEREVAECVHAAGRAVAAATVEVRARVSGYLQAIHFTEGSLVKEQDLLFEIDARPNEANLRQCEANLEATQVKLQRWDAEFARARQLLATRAISQTEFDKIASERAEAAAAVQPARSAVERARLDLSYTKLRAPIAGRIGRSQITVGNLVLAGDQTVCLATIVSVDPMHVYFDVDERTLLRMRQLARESTAPISEVTMGLANEEGHPHRGKIDFVDNQLDTKTGTLRVRAVLSNKNELLIPGLSVRVKIPMGRPRQAILVNERAIIVNDGKSFLYTVDDNNEVKAQPVRLGQKHDGLREIEAGLKASDRIIINSLQQVRPGIIVEPKLTPMPLDRQDQGASKSGIP